MSAMLFDVAAAADVILGGSDFENFPADIAVTHLDRVDDVAERNAVSDKFVWIEIDLVLLYEAADRRDFGNAFHGLERVTQIPILNRAQFGEVVFSGVIDERVFVNPADAGGVRADDRIHAFGKRAAHRIEIFNHARTRPINVRAVLKDDVDERFAEHRFAANEFHFGRGDEDAWKSDK